MWSRNPRLTSKDRGAIKGALRRAFARSDLHEEILILGAIEHSDPKRPRCKKWSWCEECGEVVPQWTITIDHDDPVIPVTTSFEDMTLDEAVARMWCDPKNLRRLCAPCHDRKTAGETELRKQRKKT